MRSKITSVSLYWIRIRIRKSIRIRIRISIRMYPVLCRLNPDSVKKRSGFDRIRKKHLTYTVCGNLFIRMLPFKTAVE